MTTILESFVDSTGSLPPDLQRHLNTIKAIDEKCIELSDIVQRNVNQLLLMPSAHAHGPTEEYIDLSRRVEHDQRLLLQFAEEKVQVAQQVYDLLEMHSIEVEKNIEDLEGDLRGSGAYESLDFYNPGFIPLDSSRGRTPRLEEWGPLPPTPIEALVAPLPSIILKRPTPSIMPKSTLKRPREDEDFPSAATPMATPDTSAIPVVPPMTGPTALTMHGGNLEIPTAPLVTEPAGPNPAHTKRKLPQANFGALEDTLSGQAALDQPAIEQQQPLPTFINPRPMGLLDSAPKPQAPGKYLYPADITEALKGRHAELFWPPDSLWYLIEIQDVNVESKKATIMYSTGDVEELDLDEIARDMHMSIISNGPG